jgi:hypothetical protein
MAAEVTMSQAIQAILGGKQQKTLRERWFFLSVVVLMFAVVISIQGARFFLVGFYYPPDFRSEIIHIHVAIVASWMLVLLAQTLLGWLRNYTWHRQLGTVGMGLAVLMLIFGVLATADMLEREPSATNRSIVPILQITSFAFFAGLAYLRRADHEAHNRFMVLAMVDPLFGVLAPVTHRYLGPVEHYANFSWVFLLMLIGYDLWKLRHVHPVTAWGSLLLVLVQDVRVPLGQTAAWVAVAEWMRSWGV